MIRFGDNDIAGLAPREICHRGIGRTFQIAATFGSMTVAENVQMALIAHSRQACQFRWPCASITETTPLKFSTKWAWRRLRIDHVGSWPMATLSVFASLPLPL